MNSEVITGRIYQILAHSQVQLRCDNRFVPERKLDLFQGGPAFVGQLRERPSQVVRRQADAQPFRIVPDHAVHALWRQAVPYHTSTFVQRTEDMPRTELARRGLDIDRRLAPAGNGHRPNALVLADQIGDQPAPFPLLQVFESEGAQFFAP